MGMRATGVKSAIRSALQSQTASSTAIMAIGMGLRLIFQTLAFVLVSRVMGAAEFGAFGSVAALVGIIGAFSGWGADVLVIKTVARIPNSFAQAWGSGLVFLAISAPPLALSALLIVPMLVNKSISYELIFFVALADIIFARINAIGAACYQAVDRPMGSARLYVGFNGTRFLAALLWVNIAGTDSSSWAVYYCGASAVFAMISLLLVWRDLGAPVWNVMWQQWRDGFHFSLLSASSIASQITTPMVGLLSDLATAGIYAAAIRIVEAAVIPFYAFTFSTISRFFRAGVGGAHESRKLAVRLLPGGLVTSFFGSICILLFAPLAPRLLGQSYAATGPVMMILAVLPMVYSVYLLAADVLISSRYVGSRVLLQCMLPLLNVAFCGLLVPQFGAAGAAVAVLISNTIMASAAWILVLMVSLKSAPAERI